MIYLSYKRRTLTPTKENIDTIDYNQYLKKIWIVDSWDGREWDYDYPSFFITKIENEVLEGKLKTSSIAMPDFFLLASGTFEIFR